MGYGLDKATGQGMRICKICKKYAKIREYGKIIIIVQLQGALAVTLSSQPKFFGNTGWTSWGGVDEIVLEEAYVMSSGSNYWPFDSQPNLDNSYGAIILENSDGSSTYNVPYLNSDVQQGGFIEFGIEIPKGKDTELYFDWEFTGNGDGYENDAAFIGTTVKYEGNSYYEPINWEIIDFAVGFGPWVWNDNTILEYEDGIGQFDSGEELYDIEAEVGGNSTSGYFEVDFGDFPLGDQITAAKLIIGAAEISVDGSNYYSDNKFSISNIELETEDDDDYTLPGDDDDDDDDYTLHGDDEDDD